MNLYQYKYAISAVPAENAQEAANRYYEETDGNEADEKDFVVLIPHEDFIKIFRLARTLNSIDQYTAENVRALVEAYAKQLGYQLSPSDLWCGILKWAERFSDVDDEDIEEWMNC
jgi:hypothetical protein